MKTENLDVDIYSNDVHYFFTLHGPRFEFMNNQMAAALSKKFGREFRPIRIFNAWPSQTYDKPNYVILNRRGHRLAKELNRPVIYLFDYEDINVEFATSPRVAAIAKELLKKQPTIYVFPFTTAFLDLPANEYTIIGPNPELARNLDSKVNQVKLFKKLGLPHNNARIFSDEVDLLNHAEEVIPGYVSASYTSGGSESGLIYSREMLQTFLTKLRPINKRSAFTVSEIFEDIVVAPNTNALVTSDGQVYTLVVSDQILQGNRYLGNIYPSSVNKSQNDQAVSITQKIGEYLAGQGYRGLFGCDFLMNKSCDMVVVDLNPRHQGGYACNGLMLEQLGYNLADIELAVTLDEQVELDQGKLNTGLGFAWAHRKIAPNEEGVVLKGDLQKGEIELPFRKIGENFTTAFYQPGSVFVGGYVGYQVHSAQTRDELEPAMFAVRANFEESVLGL